MTCYVQAALAHFFPARSKKKYTICVRFQFPKFPVFLFFPFRVPLNRRYTIWITRNALDGGSLYMSAIKETSKQKRVKQDKKQAKKKSETSEEVGEAAEPHSAWTYSIKRDALRQVGKSQFMK
jgi:hypothetical protein